MTDIKELALRVAKETDALRPRIDPQDRDIEFAQRFLAAYLAEQEPYEIEWPEYHPQGMGCGLEDRCITDRYEAMAYGWNCALDSVAECLPDALFTAPPLPRLPRDCRTCAYDGNQDSEPCCHCIEKGSTFPDWKCHVDFKDLPLPEPAPKQETIMPGRYLAVALWGFVML